MNETDTLIVEGLGGERKIKGSIAVSGSKNDALQALPATLLFDSPLTLTNVPEIEDIEKLSKLLSELGVKITRGERILTLDSSAIDNSTLDPAIAKKLRASIILTGPLLARTGKVSFPHPGGCVIGERPIDLFLSGFERMGAKVSLRDDVYHLTTKDGKLKGAEIFFRNQTVTGTECFLLAAVLARGRTVLKNCALEPEITSLASTLVSYGAKIKGIGTTTLIIEGGSLLTAKNPTYAIIPDRIEAGSFLILGALATRELRITHCDPEHLESLISLLRQAGVKIEVKKGEVVIKNTPRQTYHGVNVKTHEYPGFPTDLQALMSVFLTQAEGESRIFETIFEGRLAHLETLARMGANVNIHNQHQATIVGGTPLTGRDVTSPDLRAGLAYLLAGIIAKGQTVIHNVHYIDRGYEKIDERLSELGFKIKRHH